MKITLVLVLRIDPDRPVSDLDRFMALGLPSLNRFVGADFVHELLVVVPPEDVRTVSDRFAQECRFALRIVDENALLPEAAGSRGWYKQQVIKLAVAYLVNTPWYLTLDADVLCVRPVDSNFLFPDGRAVWQQERAGNHMDWWTASRRVLGSQHQVEDEQLVIGATPALIHTESMRSLVARLGASFPDRSWAMAILQDTQLPWTEYTLYWIHLIDTGCIDSLYATSERVMYALADSIWLLGQVETKDADWLDRVFDPAARHGFFVFQSNMELPLSVPLRLLRSRLGGPSSPTLSERMWWSVHSGRHLQRRIRHLGSRIARRVARNFG